ncbi:Uncharacterized protein NEOC65_000946 [Neochlamydia sp. AcF65]|uniref:hypothetical protein n=1 Tax=Neochlamydia sp. AcF65 TaxID=2795735 RepID=UPI001BC97370|nr:hypothetical protein [Neochlamydia sp. AcF65]MBS4165874.1 Uncharacterized protein [Neochlamydia sp. AcF65]
MQITPPLGPSPYIFYREPAIESEEPISNTPLPLFAQESRATPSLSSLHRPILPYMHAKGTPEESLLKKRLIKYLGREKDLLGETVAHLYAESSSYTSEEKNILATLLPDLKLPWFIVTEEQRKEIIEQGVSVASHPLLQPFHRVLAKIADTITSITTPSLIGKLEILETYYCNFINQLLKASSLEKREALLALKAQVCGDSVGFLLLDIDKARAMLSIDELGLPCRTNTHGRHAVASLEGLHCKANPTAALVSDYLRPAWEYAATSLTQAFSLGPFIAAPTALLKISHVLTSNWHVSADQEAKKIFREQSRQGKSSRQIFAENPGLRERLCTSSYGEARTLQVGYTVGHSSGVHRPTAILLADLISVLEMFDILYHQLSSEELIRSWDYLLEVAHQPCFSTPIELFQSYKAWMEQLPDEQRLAEFSSSGEFSLRSEEQGLRMFYLDYLKVKGESNFGQLLAILKLHPRLAWQASLANLVDLPLALRWIIKLFPNHSLPDLSRLIPPLLGKLDKEAFSSLIIASLLVLPNDGKADNYIAEIEWESTEVKRLRLVCIDNDRAFEPALTPINKGHGIHLKCLPLLLKGCMNQPVSQAVKEFMVNLEPVDFLLKWIQQLDQRNQAYQRLITQKQLLQEDLWDEGQEKKLDIPLCLPQGLFSNLHKKLKTIQDMLGHSPINHYELFKNLEPTAFACYQALMQRHANPLDALLTLHRHRTTAEALIGPIALSAHDLQSIKVSLEEEASAFLTSLDWSASIPSLLNLLKAVAALSFYIPLPLSLMQKQNLLFMAIDLGNVSLVKLALQQGAQVNQADESGQTALHKLMRTYTSPQIEERHLSIIADLLLEQKDINLNAVDNDYSPPLFPLINRASHAPNRFTLLLAKLVKKGADLDYPDFLRKGETPLEKAMSQDKIFVFTELAKKGAGGKAHPAKILEFAKKHAHNPQIGQALYLLEAQLPSFAYLRSLALLTLPPKEEGFLWVGINAGKVQLHPSVIAQLSLNKAWRFEKTSNTYGRRAVVAVSYLQRKMHFKPDPEMAGIEYAVGRLHELIVRHGTPQTELFKCYDILGKPYAVLASQTIEGQNLQEALQNGNTLEDLDLHRLQNMMIMAMLINPEDGKPDNYILQTFINYQGEEKKQLVCIDNDHAWVPSFSQEGKLQVKCILFCLNQMNISLHPQIREHFLNLKPLEILQSWLKDLEYQQLRYTELFNEKEREFTYAYNKQNPVVISILLPPKTVAKLYQKLTRLQCALQENSSLTPLDLLIRLDPPLGRYYANLLTDALLSPLSRFLKGAGKSYQVNPQGLVTISTSRFILKSCNMLTENIIANEARYLPKEALKELETLIQQSHPSHLRNVADALQIGNIQPFQQLLTDELREATLAFINISQHKQELVLLKAMTSSSFYSLFLNYCNELTSSLLIALIKASPSLRLLEARGCYKINKFKAKDLSTLTHLNLSYCFKLSTFSLQAPKLRFLSLKDNAALTSFELKAPCLEELELEGCSGLSAETIRRIAINLPHLKRLTLKGCDISSLPYHELIYQQPLLIRYKLDTFSEKFRQQLKALLDNSLQAFDSLDQLFWNFQAALVNALGTNSLLTKLALNNSMPGNHGITILAKALTTNTSLTHLTLKNNMITPEGAKDLAKVLKDNRYLRKLDLSLNFTIDDEGAIALAKALKSNFSLTYLNLTCNRIHSEGGIALAHSLQDHASLTTLKLDCNKIKDQGAIALAQMLVTNTSLTNLNLGINEISDAGSIALAKVLQNNTTLTKLNLADNVIGDLGISAWPQIFTTNTSLTALNLDSGWINRTERLRIKKTYIYDLVLANGLKKPLENPYLFSLAREENLSQDKMLLEREVCLQQEKHLSSLQILFKDRGLNGEPHPLPLESLSQLVSYLWSSLNDYSTSIAFHQVNEETKRRIAHFQIQLLDLMHREFSLFSQKELQQAQNYLSAIYSYLVDRAIISEDFFLNMMAKEER